MFTSEAFINSVQDAKKQAINTFVLDKKVAEQLVNVVDAQTVFAKTIAQNTANLTEMFVASAKVPFSTK